MKTIPTNHSGNATAAKPGDYRLARGIGPGFRFSAPPIVMDCPRTAANDSDGARPGAR